MSENKSGLVPKGRCILVTAYEPEMDRMRRLTGLFIPPTVTEKTAVWESRARVVAVGAMAWDDEKEPRAQPGDLVLITKFAGFVMAGADGRLYRFVNDRDVFGQITDEAVPSGDLQDAPHRLNSREVENAGQGAVQ